MTDETMMFDNGFRPHQSPRRSVLIAFAERDPTQLLAELTASAESLDVVVLDNGSGDAALDERVTARIARLLLPARFVCFPRGAARAAARNRLVLARAARRKVLDVDAPGDHLASLKRWLERGETARAA